MIFKFHLYVQKHRNRTYTVVALPFYDISAYGINLTDIKAEISEAIKEQVQNTAPARLHHLEFDSRVYLRKTRLEIRPVDRKKRNKRREKVQLVFSLLVQPMDDGQLYVTVPKLGTQGPSFYAYNSDELDEQATIELSSWLDNMTLDQLMSYQYARSEVLETLEVEVDVKKPKERQRPDEFTGLNERDREEEFWALKEMGINMTAQANEKRFRKAYRREEEIKKIMHVLTHSRNNSVLLVGESESGKTAIVYELVRRLAREDAPSALLDREVWMLAPDRIIAGAQFIGTWEERINDLVNECRKKQHILYITDLPGLLEIGRWSKSDNNVAQALKPHIASGEVVVIGEAAPDRALMGERLGADFMNLFRRVEVSEMTEEEARSVISNVARDLEREYDVRIEPEANDAATRLARRFLPYRAFPGKSIRLLEETVAEVSRKKDSGSFNRPSSGSFLRRIERRQYVRRQHVLDAFSRHSGMPEFIVNDKTRMELESVAQYFTERVRGQNHAVDAMVNLVATVKAGLNDPNKPMGTFLFIGPTGVGKTHLAKTLASYLFGDANRLIRFDMSEYSDVDGVARLIGAFNSEGELTKQVRTQPFSVILLDEFEKASPRIYDIFLQVLGEGRLTDAGGRTTFFHNSIIILTSNLGSGEGSFRGMGFGSDDSAINRHEINEALVTHYRGQVERYFRPEFVNRLDQVVVFQQLDPLALRSIASRELGEILLRDGITRRNLLVELDDAVIDLVLEKGYSPQYGARPLKREIERLIVAPMARQLAGRSVEDAELLRIEVDRETREIQIKSVPIDEARTKVALSAGDDDLLTRRLHMDTGELLEGFAVLRRKLADWMESETIQEMTTEKASLLARTQLPDFWDNPEDARRHMSRFYFLDRLTRRLRQLYERCEYLEDFAVLVNRERDLRYQPELASDYEELYRNVTYFEIELRTGHLPHRHQAMMLLNRLGQAPSQDAEKATEWNRTVARMYLQWAERKGYDRDVYLLEPESNSPGGMAFQHIKAASYEELVRRFNQHCPVDEIAIFFEGSNVFGFLKGERGTHKLTGIDTTRDELTRVQVFAIPDGTSIKSWLTDYQRIKIDIVEGRRPTPPAEKRVVVRTYSLDKQGEKFIRDMRTGVRTVQTRKVIEQGQLDPFILAYLQQEEGGVAWEDRFPPTFPF